jgi:ribosomal protein L11 methyltransferase
VGYDIDEWSATNATHNAVINQVDQHFTSLLGDVSVLDNVKGTFDVVMANINRNILLADMPMMCKKLAPGGVLLLSGFYTADTEVLTEKAKELGLTVKKQCQEADWVCLTLCSD